MLADLWLLRVLITTVGRYKFLAAVPYFGYCQAGRYSSSCEAQALLLTFLVTSHILTVNWEFSFHLDTRRRSAVKMKHRAVQYSTGLARVRQGKLSYSQDQGFPSHCRTGQWDVTLHIFTSRNIKSENIRLIPAHLLADLFVTSGAIYLTVSTVQYSTVQYSTVQCSTVQYSTVQYSTVQ